jgi:superfamily II DNA/RNA helicase
VDEAIVRADALATADDGEDAIVRVEPPSTDELELLAYEGSGASRSFSGLPPSMRAIVKSRAEELDLSHEEFPDGSVMVYTPPEEFLFGTVPFSWEELGLQRDIVAALLSWSPEPLEKPTHPQSFAIPKLLAGNDLVIQGETGSGKTLAYLLPALQRAALRANNTPPETSESGLAVRPQDEEDLEEIALVYRVERYAGVKGIRTLQRPDAMSPVNSTTVKVGEEFVAAAVDEEFDEDGETTVQYIEMADGRGWISWDLQDIKRKMDLSRMSFKMDQRVVAQKRLQFGSGDVVEVNTFGTVKRLRPLIGVAWDGVEGVKAMDTPRQSLRIPRLSELEDDYNSKTNVRSWAKYAPDVVILAPNRELCEQTADVARTLGGLLPERLQKEWSVAVAVGVPPGVSKNGSRGRMEWPFPGGEAAPKVLVATPDFMGYYIHRRHVPLWANVNYMVYDEVDFLLSEGHTNKMIERIKTMFKRAARQFQLPPVQSVAVVSTLNSEGARSPRMKLRWWMPGALTASQRPDMMHRVHPLIKQSWKLVPQDFDEKVRCLVEYLDQHSMFVDGEVSGNISDRRKRVMQEKTVIFVQKQSDVIRLGEILATGHNYGEVGIFCSRLGPQRRENFHAFRDGKIRLLVATPNFARGIDIPDLKHVVQFDLGKDVDDYLHAIGRCSRGGTVGHAMTFYSDGFQGGRLLAESIQDLGTAPLDALFCSRGKSLAKAFESTLKFKSMLEWQGMELPQHLKDPEPPKQIPLLADVLEGLDEDGYMRDEDGLMSDEDAERAFLSAGGSFDDGEDDAVDFLSDEDADREYFEALDSQRDLEEDE